MVEVDDMQEHSAKKTMSDFINATNNSNNKSSACIYWCYISNNLICYSNDVIAVKLITKVANSSVKKQNKRMSPKTTLT
jgi:hypothetical protein